MSIVDQYYAIEATLYKNKAGAFGRAVAIVVQTVTSDRDLYTVRLSFVGAERSNKAAVGYLFSFGDFRRLGPKNSVGAFFHACIDSLG